MNILIFCVNTYLTNNFHLLHFSITMVNFHSHNNELFLVVGTAKDANLAPRTCSSGYLYVYQFSEDGNNLNLFHKVKHLSGYKLLL